MTEPVEAPARCDKLLTRDYVCGREPQHDGRCGEPYQKGGRRRAHFLPAPEAFALNAACVLINQAFKGGFGCYLVGSAIERRDYRDVDVRMIMEDAEYDALFGTSGDTERNARWSLMCLSISTWLRAQTGLPVDFQIQRQTQANATHGGHRNALGIFLDYQGERPSDVKPEG